jgi:hypothetical protein
MCRRTYRYICRCLYNRAYDMLLAADAALEVGQSAATGSGWNAGGEGRERLRSYVGRLSAKLNFVQHCLFLHET